MTPVATIAQHLALVGYAKTVRSLSWMSDSTIAKLTAADIIFIDSAVDHWGV